MELTPKFLRNFRCVLLVSSGIYSAVTLLTLSQGNDCPGSNIRIALWLTFSVQISAFTLLLMHFVYLGWLLKKCEKLLTFYYLYVILAMLSVQLLFFQSGSNGGTLPVPEQPQQQTVSQNITAGNTTIAAEAVVVLATKREYFEISCFKHSPGLFTWLLIQIATFYLLTAYLFAICGSYICWQADEEETLLKEAIKKYIKKEQGMIQNDMSEPLLGKKKEDVLGKIDDEERPPRMIMSEQQVNRQILAVKEDK